jgi:hypothetical protein
MVDGKTFDMSSAAQEVHQQGFEHAPPRCRYAKQAVNASFREVADLVWIRMRLNINAASTWTAVACLAR